MERKKITFDSFIRGVILGVIIIGILMLLKRLSSVLLPFFIAWLIAYLIYPLVTFFQYRLNIYGRDCNIARNNRYTVDNIKRFVSRVHRACSTYANLQAGSRLPTG